MELNSNYRIVYNSENVILQFFEQREKQLVTKVKNIDTGKNNIVLTPTGEFFEYTDDFYYPSLKTALNGFLIKCTWGIENAKEVLEQLNKIELIINKLNK